MAKKDGKVTKEKESSNGKSANTESDGTKVKKKKTEIGKPATRED